jgi:hypothetical protein
MRLQWYLNAPSSPDMSPIENTFRSERQGMKEFDFFDDDMLHTAIMEQWARISQATINRYVLEMPDRLKA